MAHRGHFPAIDVLASASRLFNEVATEPHQSAAIQARKTLATYREVEDLIQIGAYKPGAIPETDAAIKATPKVNQFLQQGLNRPSPYGTTLQELTRLAEQSQLTQNQEEAADNE